VEVSPFSCYLASFSPKYLPQHLILKYLQPMLLPRCERSISQPCTFHLIMLPPDKFSCWVCPLRFAGTNLLVIFQDSSHIRTCSWQECLPFSNQSAKIKYILLGEFNLELQTTRTLKLTSISRLTGNHLHCEILFPFLSKRLIVIWQYVNCI